MQAQHRLSVALEKREGDYSQYIPLTIFCGTWNVNGKKPTSSLSEWLLDSSYPDLYVLGFQELDLTSSALLLGETARARVWENLLLDDLNSQGAGVSYSLYASKQLVGGQSCSAGCGLMGTMGNKGGVGIRFQLYDTTFCFINTHLSAHTENYQRRNQDFRDICTRITFSECNLFSHDVLIWLGDLNYRLDIHDSNEVKQKIIEGAYAELLIYDQLREQQKLGLAFEKFKEAPITFAPSYKYNPGTNVYDTSDKQRVPAWCDRVLWYERSKVKVIWYGRHELLLSDHKPVTALMSVSSKVVNWEMKQKVMGEIRKQYDRIENDGKANCELSTDTLDFGDVRHMIPTQRSFIIRNKGSEGSGGVVNFRFTEKPGESNIAKSWWKIAPEWGILEAGEEMTISITVFVEEEAASLNLGNDVLNDILIIQLENETQHFLEVRGHYIVSCMGNYLDYLIRQPQPIREKAEILPVDSPHLLSVPKELWRIVDVLSTHPNNNHLFTKDGNLKEVQLLIECLDTGKPLPECSIHSVCETLLRFLDGLVEPVIPFSMYERCITAHSYAQRKQILSSLKTVNYNVFYYIMAFLRDRVLQNQVEPASVSGLATTFSDVIIRAPTRSPALQARKRASEFVQEFLLAPKLMVP